MVRLVIGEYEQTGWCVARINKESHDADIMVLEEYGSMTKAEAWDKAWELNETYGEKDHLFIALCKIDL